MTKDEIHVFNKSSSAYDGFARIQELQNMSQREEELAVERHNLEQVSRHVDRRESELYGLSERQEEVKDILSAYFFEEFYSRNKKRIEFIHKSFIEYLLAEYYLQAAHTHTQ